eukprot:TRINITY_DN74397_c0_g1_i1.p1 TRINITY_DN74397_c0_g1~~TRINITY_DN74397_c0_g1_i1.p1  ORF type:complete len:356 (-),score=88.49 TRINITY_DN74397_c0_g1_i1:25-1092(-)
MSRNTPPSPLEEADVSASAAQQAAGDGDRDNTSPSESEAQKTPFLICDCQFPIVSRDELVPERFSCWNKVVYSYELDLLETSAWCYSATNAHDNRFDLIRTLPPGRNRVFFKGKPTVEHSFFPGFAWKMCYCSACEGHLGWGFSPAEETKTLEQPGTLLSRAVRLSALWKRPDREEESPAVSSATGAATTAAACDGLRAEEDDEEALHDKDSDSTYPGLAFCGLVLTKMRREDLSDRAVEVMGRQLQSALQHKSQYHKDWREICELLHSEFPLQHFGPLLPVLESMRPGSSPIFQLQSTSVLLAVRRRVQVLREMRDRAGAQAEADVQDDPAQSARADRVAEGAEGAPTGHAEDS